MKPVSEYIQQRKNEMIAEASLDLYCDKKGWWSGKECGGQLYNVYGKGQYAQNRFNKNHVFIAAECIKCGKSYDIPIF